MIPTEVFHTYWRFAAERQSVYYRRLLDPVGPWTKDTILNKFRFTNSFRAADRVSQYLIREVQFGLGRSQAPTDLFTRTLLFKLFNKIDTWETIETQIGEVTAHSLSSCAIDQVLDSAMKGGQRVYSGAYIMPSPSFGHDRKHANHLALLRAMLEDRLPDRIRQQPTLSDVYSLLLSYPGLGPFLAFQFSIDLNYSDLIDFEEDSFVVAGPGAVDGISKCFSDTGGRTAEEVIMHVFEHQEDYCTEYGVANTSLFGRRLMPIDCQNLFCEISKYARVAHPNIPGVMGRTRIKQGYARTSRSLPAPVFPPKWQLTAAVDAFYSSGVDDAQREEAA
tara:strand:+ start:9330 stop:10331 length:1002 start_codon:yes stop_codon:yes gene_type:complete